MDFAVLTREEVEPYAPAFAAIGLEVVAMPVTHAAPPSDPGALARVLGEHRYAAIVVASPRAAYALLAVRDRVDELPDIWVVGASTKRVFDIAHVAAIHPPHVVDGAGLAHEVVASESLDGERVLVPRAEEGRDDAIRILRDAGAVVDDVIAYRTVPMPADDPRLARGRALLADRRAKVCAVFAPSQVTALDAITGALPALGCRFAAIGNTTAAALRERGVTGIAVAAAPTPYALAAALTRE